MTEIYHWVGFFTVWFAGFALLFLGGRLLYNIGLFKFSKYPTGIFWWKYTIHWKAERYHEGELCYDFKNDIYPKQHYDVKKLPFGLYLSYRKSQ